MCRMVPVIHEPPGILLAATMQTIYIHIISYHIISFSQQAIASYTDETPKTKSWQISPLPFKESLRSCHPGCETMSKSSRSPHALKPGKKKACAKHRKSYPKMAPPRHQRTPLCFCDTVQGMLNGIQIRVCFQGPQTAVCSFSKGALRDNPTSYERNQ